jgi:hypothetical protein
LEAHALRVRHFLIPLAAMAVLWSLPAVHATTVVRFAFDSLCSRAETIAFVRCTDRTSLRDEVTGRIATRTRLEVLRTIKGDPGDEIVLTLPGGQVDADRMVVPGIPQFAIGQEIVVFLTAAEEGGSPWPLGLDQGCYRARTDDTGQRSVILQSGVTPLPQGALFKPTSHKPFTAPLDRFLLSIQRELESPSGKQ